MTRISQRVALLCATGFLAALLCHGIDAGAQEKDKKVDKKDETKTDDKAKKDEKKTDDKAKKDEKKEDKKKEEFKPDTAQLELKGHKGWIYAVRFGKDGKTLASVSRDKDAKLWDLGTRKELSTLKGTSDAMKGLVYRHGTVYVIDSDMVKMTVKEKDKDKEKEKVIKVREYEIRIWDAKAGKERTPLKGHTDWILCLACDKEGKTLYSGSEDQTVKVWDLATGKDINTIKAHSKAVRAIAVSNDGATLATAGEDGVVKLWDKAGKELAAFKVENDKKTTDPKTKKETVTKEPGEPFNCVAFSPDGKRLAAGNNDGTIKIYDVDAKKELQALKTPDGIWAITYSPDGSRLATGGYGGIIKLWDATGKELRTIKAGSAPSDTITTLAFSPDGSQLASGDIVNALVKIWSVEAGKK